MGITIHAMVERKAPWPGLSNVRIGETGEDYSWVSAGNPWPTASTRNPRLFCALGDCEQNPEGQVSISGSRGLPTIQYDENGEKHIEVSSEFFAHYTAMGPDVHSPGYATYAEILEYPVTASGFPEDWVGSVAKDLTALASYMAYVSYFFRLPPTHVRIVFFFEN